MKSWRYSVSPEKELSAQVGYWMAYCSPPCFTSCSFCDESLIRFLIEDPIFENLGQSIVSLADCEILFRGMLSYCFRQLQRLLMTLSERALAMPFMSICVTYMSFVQ